MSRIEYQVSPIDFLNHLVSAWEDSDSNGADRSFGGIVVAEAYRSAKALREIGAADLAVMLLLVMHSYSRLENREIISDFVTRLPRSEELARGYIESIGPSRVPRTSEN